MSAGLDKNTVLDHVRRPDLPWRPATDTECGRALNDVAGHISRDELQERLHRLGKQRTAFTVCMTCWSTAAQWKSFEQDPVEAMRRETRGWKPDSRLAAELRALAALAAAHREEFDGFLSGLEQTTDLAQRRQARRSGGTR